MICLTCTKKTNCAIWLSEAEARIHQDSHPKHEIGDQEEERMTSEERASNFQRVYFGVKPTRVVEPEPWYLKPLFLGIVITILISVVCWLFVFKAVVEFWK